MKKSILFRSQSKPSSQRSDSSHRSSSEHKNVFKHIKTYISPDFRFLTPNKSSLPGHATARAFVEESKDHKEKTVILVPHKHFAYLNNTFNVYQQKQQNMLLKSRILSAKRFNDIFTMKKIPQEKLNSKFALVSHNRKIGLNKNKSKEIINKNIRRVNSAQNVIKNKTVEKYKKLLPKVKKETSTNRERDQHNKTRIRKNLFTSYEDEKTKFTLLLFDESVDLSKKKFKLENFISKFSDKYFVDSLYHARYKGNNEGKYE
jgi:hypothetical protein